MSAKRDENWVSFGSKMGSEMAIFEKKISKICEKVFQECSEEKFFEKSQRDLSLTK